MQVIILKNRNRKVCLAALTLSDGKALTLFNVITEVLDQYQLWKSIKVIICDTTSVNIANLRNDFQQNDVKIKVNKHKIAL